MKRSIFIFSAVIASCIFISCAATKLTQEQKEERALKVSEMIDSKDFTASVFRAIPMRGRAVQLTSPYDLKISGDSVYSYMPYFGRAYSIPYGGGEGLIFNGVMSEYKKEAGKKGAITVSFKVPTVEDTYYFYLTIFPDASADMIVTPINKSPISFSGELKLPKDKQTE